MVLGALAAKARSHSSGPKDLPRPALPLASGKTDLLLRFFDSQFFDEWIALTYLYKSNSAGVQDYLCNRLYSLPETGLERYLLQLSQLVLLRPHSSLERVLVDLCARSLRVAVKVHWLLLAFTQDHPKSKYAADLRDRCEQGAMEGYWEPPFREPKLLPLSPPRGRFFSPPLSPTAPPSLARVSAGDPFSPSAFNTSFRARRSSTDSIFSEPRWTSPEAVMSPQRYASPDLPSRPMSPDGLGGAIYSSYTMGQGLEGLICASPDAVRRVRHRQGRTPENSFHEAVGRQGSPDKAARYKDLRQELGDGEGVTALIEKSRVSGDGVLAVSEEALLSPPSSPRLRQTIFGATLDFIEALCDASSGLTSFSPEDRQWALRRGLEAISQEIELASRSGVAIWFPLGTGNNRIVRLAAKEARLLNSREKAPFMLFIEVLNEGAEQEQEQKALRRSGSGNSLKEAPSHDVVADSALSFRQRRLDSSSLAGPGPGSALSAAGLSLLHGVGNHQRSRSEILLPQSSAAEEPAAAGVQARRSLSFDQDPDSPPRPDQSIVVHPPDDSLMDDAESTSSTIGGRVPSEDSFTTGLHKAMEGLRGNGPLVSVRLEVVGAPGLTPPASPAASGPRHSASQPPPSSSAGSAADPAGLPRHSAGVGLLCRFGICRGAVCSLAEGEAEVVVAQGGGGAGCQHGAAPHVRLHLRVHGGVDLRLAGQHAASARHRRVPSHEALQNMAAQHNSPLPPAGANRSFREPPPSPRDDTAMRAATPSSAEALVDGAAVVREAAAAGVVAKEPGARLLPASASTSTSRGDSPRSDLPAPDDGVEEKGVAVAAEFVAAARAESRQKREVARRRREAQRIYGERFQERCKRIRNHSPYARCPGWTISQVIVKTGDDCRQELLAMQLIRSFHDIFQEAGLPLYLQPYEVLVTSNRTSLIECVPNTLSIHAIKAKSRPGTCLPDHFFAMFPRGTAACKTAQRNFVESMAGYSIVCYLLQIKDRHNGNILLDDEGHIIHIDFGFMLSNSPGSVNFESAPFKLTRELLEVMDSDSEGHASELFDYFKVLCIQGLLACRKHADRILLLVEMMQSSGLPCFKQGARTVQALRRRFHLNLTEAQCVEVALGLISDSLDAWRTRQYDYYQRVLNGIL